MRAVPRRSRRTTPPPGSSGQLTAPDGTALPVSVARADEGILLVTLVDPAPELEKQSNGVVLESANPRGLVRMQGRAERVDSGLVRFWVDGSPEVVQRREFVRVAAAQRVTLDAPSGRQVDTHSVNVSGGGMLVAGPNTLDLDAEVTFRLHLRDDEPPVEGVGRVVRAAEDPQRAIVFEIISQADRDRLIHFIFDRQRVALAVTRGDTL